jgi:hypothetical protein
VKNELVCSVHEYTRLVTLLSEELSDVKKGIKAVVGNFFRVIHAHEHAQRSEYRYAPLIERYVRDTRL